MYLQQLETRAKNGYRPSTSAQSFFCRVILAYFTARSNLVTLAFLQEKVKTVDFSETIAASDLKVGRSRHLIEYMKVCEY